MSRSLPGNSRLLVLHALALGVIGLTAPDAFAQSPGPAAKPEKVSPAIQRRIDMGGYHPDRMDSKGLTGHPPNLTVTPLEELPVKYLQVPSGFKIEVWAHGFPGGRMMTRGDKGTIFMGTRNIGRVYAVMDKGGKRTSRIVIDKLEAPAVANAIDKLRTPAAYEAWRRNVTLAQDRYSAERCAAATYRLYTDICNR